MLSLVARRAFFCGSRKLRAKPGFTFTTSPIWPSLGTRSSRMTFIGMASSLSDQVGQESQEAGTLDRLGELALLLGRHRRYAVRHDLAALGNEALQQSYVLVVDLGRVGAGERAALAAAREGTALGAHSSSPAGTAATGASSPKRGRSRRGGRSLQPPRSGRSPGRSERSLLRCMMADGPSSSASTRTVRKRMMSSLIDIVRSSSFTAADGASMLSRV